MRQPRGERQSFADWSIDHSRGLRRGGKALCALAVVGFVGDLALSHFVPATVPHTTSAIYGGVLFSALTGLSLWAWGSAADPFSSSHGPLTPLS